MIALNITTKVEVLCMYVALVVKHIFVGGNVSRLSLELGPSEVRRGGSTRGCMGKGTSQ